MISIVIPCYNHNHEVLQAVSSALNQKDVPEDSFEVVVVDDGSTDAIADTWEDKRVRVIRHKVNEGLPVALNTGIRHSKGERFVILAADDTLNPSYLAVMSQQDADVVSCDMFAGGRRIPAQPGTLSKLKKGNCHSYAALVRKSIFERVKGFKVSMNPSWEDYEFWLNLAKHGAQWKHVSLPLHNYNRNPVGRDVMAQGKERLLKAKLHGFHQDLFGQGSGVVGIVIPCYKHEKFLMEAVESVRAQEYPHIAMVVVDDGSPGDVLNTLKGIQNVEVIRQSNKGLSSARNVGIQYLIEKYSPEFLLMLDADDKLHSSYIEETMGTKCNENDYVYTDVQFFGAAWHRHAMKAFNCQTLLVKHQHPCTFLMPTKMWQGVVEMRGYGYDESDELRAGYEDHEFAIASVLAGYCGVHKPRALFYYRQHVEGSMRTEAFKVRQELGKYIRSKFNKKELQMACTTCGGSPQFTAVTGNSVAVSGIGALPPGAPIVVTYRGNNKSTQTKLGRGGRIYKYSGKANATYPNKFFAAAEDAYLFEGPFDLETVLKDDEDVDLPLRPVVKIPVREPKKPSPQVETVSKTPPPQRPTLDSALQQVQEPVEPDDFTLIEGVGAKGAVKLFDNGYTTFQSIIDGGIEGLQERLGLSSKVAKNVFGKVQGILDDQRTDTA